MAHLNQVGIFRGFFIIMCLTTSECGPPTARTTWVLIGSVLLRAPPILNSEPVIYPDPRWSACTLKSEFWASFPKMASLTYPQLRHKEEQVKYSSGKKELCAIWSSGISPLKRSLNACRGGKATREGTWRRAPCFGPSTTCLSKSPLAAGLFLTGSMAGRGNPMTSAPHPRPSWPDMPQSSPQETWGRTSSFPKRSEGTQQSYCALLITLEVRNTSHTQSFIQNHRRHWLMPIASFEAGTKELRPEKRARL